MRLRFDKRPNGSDNDDAARHVTQVPQQEPKIGRRDISKEAHVRSDRAQPSRSSDDRGRRQQAVRSDGSVRNVQIQPKQQPAPQPKRVAMPSFGGATRSARDDVRSEVDDWGSGATERAPLVHGEGAMPGDALQKTNVDTQAASAPQREQRNDFDSSFEESPPAQYTSSRRIHPQHGQPESGNPSVNSFNIGNAQAAPQRPSEGSGRLKEGHGHFSFKPANSSPLGSNAPQSFQSPANGTKTNADQSAADPPLAFGLSSSLADRSTPKPHQHNDSGYRTTPFDPQEYRSSQRPPSESEDPSANWQHLRRRNARQPIPNPTSRPQAKHWDDVDVDRLFQNHLQTRPTPSQRQPSSSSSPASPFAADSNALFDAFRPRTQSAQQKCGRCGELGHAARDCNGPVKARCRVCGNVGHSERDCSQRQRPQAVARRQQAPFDANDPFGGQVSDAPVARKVASDVQQGSWQRTPASDARDRPELRRMSEPAMAEPAKSANLFDEDRVSKTGRAPEAASERTQDTPVERSLRSQRWMDDEPQRENKKNRRARRDQEEDEGDDEGLAARDERNARKAARKADKQQAKVEKAAEEKAEKARRATQGPPVNLPDFVSVSHLGQLLGVRYEQFVNTLDRLGYDDVFPGKVLNSEISGMIAMEYGFEPVFEDSAQEAEDRDLKRALEPEDKEFLPTRPPVVTIMGHVDHGKTTILDYLRKSSVAAGEAGGITQHIGAFSVPLASSGKTITFLDTPGHAAFLAMRQRGANVTDIVILVVAADDSVKPQTLEAIKHAQAAGVPMIVAVNKIDKEEADLQRVKQDLARHGVEIEDFGGETQVVPVSGKTGKGMDELEENVVTLSEILDHRADTEGAVEGWVLEATTKKAGRVATVLVRRGTLKPGTIIVAGNTWARVRSLRNEGGQTLREVGPGMPVGVDGWRDQPAAGDEVLQAPSEQKANDVVDFRLEKAEREKTAVDMEAINEARRLEQEKREREAAAERAKLAGQSEPDSDSAAAATNTEAEKQTGIMEVPFIIKADVSGSAEAVSAYILSTSSPLIAPRILSSAVGPVHESDVELASAAQGHIISFNLPADEVMKGQAASKGVKILENNIIYRVLDDVKAVLEEKLPPIVSQRVLGEAEISARFEISVGGRKKMKIAGCKVRNGVIGRGSRVRILRGDQKVYDGESRIQITASGSTVG